MIREIIVEPEADADLTAQAIYFSDREGDAELAARFYKAAQETFDLLASQPGIGTVRKFPSSRLAGARMYPIRHFENSLVFYVSNEDELRVVRVLHGARNIREIMDDQA